MIGFNFRGCCLVLPTEEAIGLPPPPTQGTQTGTQTPPAPPNQVTFFGLPYVDSGQTGGFVNEVHDLDTGDVFQYDQRDVDFLTSAEIDTTQESDVLGGPLFGTDDPFAIVGDLAGQLLSGGGGRSTPQTT